MIGINPRGVTVQSVARALDILECFAGQEVELGISDIAEAMMLNKSTIYGLVNTLTVRGYLEQNPGNKKYKLGLKLFELGSAVERRMDIRMEAKPFCQELAKKNGHGTHLAVLSNDEMVYLDKIDPPGFSITYSYVGKRAKMYCTGVGKAVLAYMPREFQDDYIRKTQLSALTVNTIIDSQVLMKELEKIRRQSYAVDDEEVEYGVKCIAAPIFNSKGNPVAAISTSGMTERIHDSDIPGLAQVVINCALGISKRLGYCILK